MHQKNKLRLDNLYSSSRLKAFQTAEEFMNFIAVKGKRNKKRDREIMELYLGIRSHGYLTLDSIGEIYKITGNRVRQIVMRIAINTNLAARRNKM